MNQRNPILFVFLLVISFFSCKKASEYKQSECQRIAEVTGICSSDSATINHKLQGRWYLLSRRNVVGGGDFTDCVSDTQEFVFYDDSLLNLPRQFKLDSVVRYKLYGLPTACGGGAITDWRINCYNIKGDTVYTFDGFQKVCDSIFTSGICSCYAPGGCEMTLRKVR